MKTTKENSSFTLNQIKCHRVISQLVRTNSDLKNGGS